MVITGLTPEQVRLISDWAYMSAERAGAAPTGLLYQEIFEAAEDALQAPLVTAGSGLDKSV